MGPREPLQDLPPPCWIPPLADVLEAPAKATPRSPLLLPANTPNLLCNWSAVSAEKVDVLLTVLRREVWKDPDDSAEAVSAAGTFFDLGCGDGRVVLQVCQAFPRCRGIGVDLNAELIAKANRSRKRKGLEGRCEFLLQDLADVQLGTAVAVFLYLPATALSLISQRVLKRSGLPKGAAIFSADGPLPCAGAPAFGPLRPGRCRRNSTGAWAELHGLFCYEWYGTEGPPSRESSTPRLRRSAAPMPGRTKAWV